MVFTMILFPIQAKPIIIAPIEYIKSTYADIPIIGKIKLIPPITKKKNPNISTVHVSASSNSFAGVLLSFFIFLTHYTMISKVTILKCANILIYRNDFLDI